MTDKEKNDNFSDLKNMFSEFASKAIIQVANEALDQYIMETKKVIENSIEVADKAITKAQANNETVMDDLKKKLMYEYDKVNAKISKPLDDEKLSNAARKCLQNQSLNAQKVTDETMIKIRDCKNDKKEEIQELNRDFKKSVGLASGGAENLRLKLKQCLDLLPQQTECSKCLNKVSENATDAMEELGKELKIVIDRFEECAKEFEKCARPIIQDARNQLDQVRKDSQECLKLK